MRVVSLINITFVFVASSVSASDYVYNIQCRSRKAKKANACHSRQRQIFDIIKYTADKALGNKGFNPVRDEWKESTSENRGRRELGCSSYQMRVCDWWCEVAHYDYLCYSVNNCDDCGYRNLRRTVREVSRRELDLVEDFVAEAVHRALSAEVIANDGKKGNIMYPKPCLQALESMECEVRMAEK